LTESTLDSLWGLMVNAMEIMGEEGVPVGGPGPQTQGQAQGQRLREEQGSQAVGQTGLLAAVERAEARQLQHVPQPQPQPGPRQHGVPVGVQPNRPAPPALTLSDTVVRPTATGGPETVLLPHEDPELVGPVAAQRATDLRRYREAVRAGEDDGSGWDFWHAQSADLQQRRRVWKRNSVVTTARRGLLGRRVELG